MHCSVHFLTPLSSFPLFLCRYIEQFYCEDAINVPAFKLSHDIDQYEVPPDGDLPHYIEFIRDLPPVDNPAAFGQHLNAEMSCQMDNSRELLGTILALQPQSTGGGGEGVEEAVLQQAALMEEQIPGPWNFYTLVQNLNDRPDPAPLKSVSQSVSIDFLSVPIS